MSGNMVQSLTEFVSYFVLAHQFSRTSLKKIILSDIRGYYLEITNKKPLLLHKKNPTQNQQQNRQAGKRQQ